MPKDVDYVAMGKRIKDLRERNGWTQETLMIKAGFESQSYMSGIESGAEHLGLPGLKAVANALDVTMDYLESGTIETVKSRLQNEMQDVLEQGNDLQQAMMIELFHANAKIVLKYCAE